jgi:Spy/CpxP family protein refolding chaperone
MRKVILAISAFMLALILPAMPMAGEHKEECGGARKGREMMMHRMEGMHARHAGYTSMVLSRAEELKLSDEQLGKILRIQQQHRTAYKEIMEKLHKSMQAGYKEYMDPNADEAAIRKAAQEHAAVFNKLVEEGLKERKEVNAVLTPAQKAQLLSIKREIDNDRPHEP